LARLRLAARLVATLLLLLVAACSTAETPSRWAQLPAGQRATIFGSITADISQQPMMRYLIKYRNVDTGEKASISISPKYSSMPSVWYNGEPDLQEPGKLDGALFDISVPPGRYEFYDVWMVGGSGYVSYYYYPKGAILGAFHDRARHDQLSWRISRLPDLRQNPAGVPARRWLLRDYG
jgi:hypothetical protein